MIACRRAPTLSHTVDSAVTSTGTGVQHSCPLSHLAIPPIITNPALCNPLLPCRPELQGREVAHVLAFSPQQATYIKKVAKGMGVEVVVEQAALRHCQLPDTSAQVRPAGKISMWLLRSSASIKVGCRD